MGFLKLLRSHLQVATTIPLLGWNVEKASPLSQVMEKQNAEEEAWKHEESKKEASEASQSCISGATKTVEYRPCTVNKRWSNYHPELIQKDLYIHPYVYI